jgi:hypothetical protein
VCFHHFFDQRKPQPGPPIAAGRPEVGLKETFPDVGQVLVSNPDALVCDSHYLPLAELTLPIVFCDVTNLHANQSTRWAEFDRVVQQVFECPGNLAWVDIDFVFVVAAIKFGSNGFFAAESK